MKSKRRMTAVVLAAVALGAMLTLGACTSDPAGQEQAALYQCPMHPDVTSDKAGDCPICGMRLVPVDLGPKAAKAAELPAQGAGEREILYWVAPMDASFTSPTPGKSPMGMDLVPVYKNEVGAASDVDGRATVAIDARRIQQLGVRMAAARVTDAVQTIRTVGFVEPDAQRIRHMHVKISGWLERVPVQTPGDPVARGQVLYELYSPDLVATQEELLAAVRAGNAGAAAAARERLSYWDVAAGDIAAIERGGKVWRRIPFRSPSNGYIHEIKAVEGTFVREMTELYVLMNLDRVWVLGKFYETDLEVLRVGASANVRLPSGKEVRSEALYVYPTVDRQTRFVSVRFSFANQNLALRPGMYVDVVYRAELGPAVVVPADAVIRTGSRAIAFVDLGGGRFEPRELDIGPMVDGGVVVYDGIDDGDLVAVQANFFIDSESSLKAALAKFSGGGGHNH